MDWLSMITPTMPVLEIFTRGTITFLVLYALLRIVGRRESASVGMTDVLVIVLIADAASTGMVGDTQTLADGFLLVVVILFWSLALDALSYWFPWFRKFAKAGPTTLIEDGELVRKTMRREFMTEGEVKSQLRMNGIEDLEQVRRVYLEGNGGISIITEDDDDSAEESAHKHGRNHPSRDVMDDPDG